MSYRDDLYFNYAGINSTDMGLENINFETSFVNEPFLGNQAINEITVRGNDVPYFQDVSISPLVITLQFYYSENTTINQKREIARWLKKTNYQDLYFSNNIDRIFRCIYVGSPTIFYSADEKGYIEIQMRCDSPYTYSQTYISPIYNCSGNTNIFLENNGDLSVFPEISLLKSGNGDFEIINTTNNNQSFKFTDLSDNEDLYIDNEKEIIVTDKVSIYRYNDFNNNFLELVYGINNLQVIGNGDLQFRYRNKTLYG